jgi:protein gp37
VAETTIQWTATRHPDGRMLPGFTMNPWIGCERKGPECDNCYAEAGSKRLAAQYGLKLWEDDRYFTGANYWKNPAKWNRLALREGVRLKVFCASYGDVFEDRPEFVDPRARLLDLIPETPSLDWLLLSKRTENMVRMTEKAWGSRWPNNAWAGGTVGVRASMHRLDELRMVPAAVRFMSGEPLLEDLGDIDLTGIRWVIIGGESGAKARPFAIEWGRRLAAQASAVGAATFWKQLGARPIARNGYRLDLADGHGGDMAEWPEEVPRVRDWPAVAA